MNPLTLPDAWSVFRYFLRTMAAVTDEPARLAARLWVRAIERDELLRWLAPLERFLRLLLLAEAATITLAPLRPRAYKPRREFKGSRKRPVPEDSEDWRVSFQAIEARRRRRKREPRPHYSPDQRPNWRPEPPRPRVAPTVYDSVPLAARLEALVRVALDPTPYAKRLARKLSKRRLTRKQTRILFRPPNLETPFGRAFEHALQSFLDLARPARVRFESG